MTTTDGSRPDGTPGTGARPAGTAVAGHGRPARSATRRRAAGRQDPESGAVAVEFALVLLPLVLILFGIIDFGRVYDQQLGLTAAAREGVRTMAVQNSTAAARSAARAAAPQLSPALTDAQIQISPATCSIGTTVRVTVTYPLSSVSGFFTGLFAGRNLTGTGVMRCGG
ncbi:TadE/TadG family type IV pilus assembly protein [Nakamurella endophytica]|uniref:TadE-like domain-containing protein n=1 Tax=Nakamurella endophytica TaxID=1748367 RepID=A0A917WAK4_9ACTN|nr:TadE family protein [Nakamurella endophytica]GGL88892.1 hypothetical protein GCM10011594_05690 [Nakamurella endophytica]